MNTYGVYDLVGAAGAVTVVLPNTKAVVKYTKQACNQLHYTNEAVTSMFLAYIYLNIQIPTQNLDTLL